MPFDDPAIGTVGIIGGIGAGDVSAPAAPTGLSAIAGNGQVSLDWDDNTESDFRHYEVYRGTVSGGPYTLIATLTTSQLVVTGLGNGIPYYFAVAAVDTSDNRSTLSSQATATPFDTGGGDVTPPAAPTGLSQVAGNQQVALDWNNNSEGDLAGYLVYRATVSGGPYTRIASIAVSAYTATGLTNGTTYYFVVTALDTSGNESANSSQVSSTPTVAADTTAPATPTGLTAIGQTGRIALDWNNNSESDLASYRVYRSTSSGGTYSVIATTVSSDYADNSVPAASTFFYKVSAVDTSANESGLSSVASAAANATTSPSGILIPAGASIQTYINNNLAGTVFVLAAGTWTGQSVAPKQNQSFVGTLSSTGARLSILDGGGSLPNAFRPGGSGVQIKNVIVQNYAPPDSGGQGAIKTHIDWKLDNVEIRNNTTRGVHFEAGTQCRNSFIHHNGRLGCGAFRAHNHVFENNEVSFNNTAGFNNADEGGGKWVGLVGAVFRGNYFHDNFDTGIWFDSENVNALIENNVSVRNRGDGIQFEISCSGIIRNNTCDNNGGSGIFINASRNVDCHNNTVRDNGHAGIHVWAQNRGSGTNCIWQTDNVDVYDNFVRMQQGFTGMQRDASQSTSIWTAKTVRFTNNDYDVPTPAGAWFRWADGSRTWTQWQGFGHDLTGSIV